MYPTPGFCDFNAGILGVVGDGGFSHSSTVSETYGVSLHHYTQSFHPGNASRRASGFQLRCLSE